MARRLEEALVVHGELTAADLSAAPVTPPVKRDPRIHHQSGPQTCQLNRGSVGKNGEGLLQEVIDCVQYSIMAHRGGHGGCIWFSWSPGGKRKSMPGHGSHFLMVSQRAAKVVYTHMCERKLAPGHFDLELLRLLKTEAFDEAIAFSFFSPPMGNFVTHGSDCDPAMAKARPSRWGESRTCQGTRVEHDEKHRDKYFGKMTDKGAAKWMATTTRLYEVWTAPPEPPLLWKTFSPLDDIGDGQDPASASAAGAYNSQWAKTSWGSSGTGWSSWRGWHAPTTWSWNSGQEEEQAL